MEREKSKTQTQAKAPEKNKNYRMSTVFAIAEPVTGEISTPVVAKVVPEFIQVKIEAIEKKAVENTTGMGTDHLASLDKLYEGEFDCDDLHRLCDNASAVFKFLQHYLRCRKNGIKDSKLRAQMTKHMDDKKKAEREAQRKKAGLKYKARKPRKTGASKLFDEEACQSGGEDESDVDDEADTDEKGNLKDFIVSDSEDVEEDVLECDVHDRFHVQNLIEARRAKERATAALSRSAPATKKRKMIKGGSSKPCKRQVLEEVSTTTTTTTSILKKIFAPDGTQTKPFAVEQL